MHSLSNPSSIIPSTINLKDIGKRLIINGNFQILPFNEYKDFQADELRLFGHKHGMYTLPTKELIDFLAEFVIKDNTIEVGSGVGVIGKALNIPCTDNKHQNRYEVRKAYEKNGQPIVPYGDHVEEIDGLEAVKKYKPKVVISSWVTGKVDIAGNPLNMHGFNEMELLDLVDTYVMVGNHEVHKTKVIMRIPHRRYTAPWIKSRATYPRENSIYVWSKKYKHIDINYS